MTRQDIPARLPKEAAARDQRLGDLYSIVDARGERVRFAPNDVQAELLRDLHTCNVILKARQLGFTTLIQLFMLDMCLFNKNVRAGTIAHTLQDAERIFRDKIKFPYDCLSRDEERRISIPAAVQNSARTLTFDNNSSLRVGTSLRSGTFQVLHVSEFGHIAARRPDQAREIRAGALNTVQAGQYVFIESTAEGRGGAFHDLCKQAGALAETGRPLSPLDFKFHFHPWYRDPKHRLDPEGILLDDEDRAYFARVEAETGAVIDAGQRAWYARKAAVQGEDMLREYPSTPDEAFAGAVEGAYFGKELSRARREARVRRVPVEPTLPVNTFWDLGVDDETAIWFHQQAGLEHRFVDYYENSGEGLNHYVRVLRDKASARGFVYGAHFLPHDVRVTSLSTGRTRLDTLKGLGVTPARVVPRTGDVADDIQAARNAIAACWFDETRCAKGLKALEGYRKEWDDKLGTFRNRPLHDWASHGADAFRCFAVGYRATEGGGSRRRAAATVAATEMMDSPWS